MPFTYLPESVITLYAELLDQVRVADAEAAVRGLDGTYVSKVIKGRRYWYLQRSEGSSKRQIYVGAETPELLEQIERGREQKSESSADERRRREIVAMLAAGGMFRESAAIAKVITVLGDAGVFRAGGVLVGTQAFTTLANVLGVRFDQESLRTADVDVAHDPSIAVGVTKSVDVLSTLRTVEKRFIAVPGFDPREPSTSFKVRGRDLRVDFLTPARSRSASTPVPLPHLGVSALPLPGLDYLLNGAIDAAFVGEAAVRVNVPQPARFALHKLWVASRRPASEAAKSRKDVRQGSGFIEVLLADRSEELVAAWNALGSLQRGVRQTAKQLNADMRMRLGDVVQDAALSRR